MILLPLFFLLYLLIWVGLVVGVGIISWRFSKSIGVTAITVVIAFFVMFWPAFGDYFPTVNAHKQYCEKEAGFKIYVTPEQWIAENPGVLETLVPYVKFTPHEHLSLGNARFGMRAETYQTSNPAVRKEIESLVDIKTKKILSQTINFSRGYWYYQPQDWRAFKIWLDERSCYLDGEPKEIKNKSKEYFQKLNTKWGQQG